MQGSKTVDDYIKSKPEWQAELVKLRDILNATGLEETIKWGAPCYTDGGKNIVGMAAFTAYFGLWFFQGALLSDPEGVLMNAQEGKTKAQRQWRFESARDIKVRTIMAYVAEAIELNRRGKEIKPDRAKPVTIPAELKAVFKSDAKLKTAFDAMSKGCRREYAEYVGEAKREETRRRRVGKIVPMILGGGGLNDRYR